MSSNYDAMDYWMQLANRLAADKVEAVKIYLHTLFPRYSEPHRHYHTLDHIVACIENFRGLCAKPLSERAIEDVELALFFHDVCYNTHAHDNEERSALMLLGCGASMGLNLDRLDYCADMVRATNHGKHVELYDDPTKWVLDMDLHSLGATPEVFIKMCLGIRQEYSWVPEDAYKAGRAKVMQSFLDRHFIYGTQECRDKWEEQARINIAGEIRRMQS